MPPLVALGGSAGSLDALMQFFELLPHDSGLAFIVVVHLAAKEESLLPELLQRRCGLPVMRAKNRQLIEPNHVYVITPGRKLTQRGSRLQVTSQHDRVAVIDMLFASIAASAQGPIAGILLSGADADGAAGLQQISDAGGLVLVQDPEEATQSTMPCAAIATGCVHAVLRVAEMPARLFAHFQLSAVLRQPSPPPALEGNHTARLTTREAELVRDVVQCLHQRTGHDFSCFRQNIVLRHLRRRIALTDMKNEASYLALMAADAAEPAALVRELLVSVTGFSATPTPLRHWPAICRSCSRARAKWIFCASGCPPAPPAKKRIPSPSCCWNTRRPCRTRPVFRCLAAIWTLPRLKQRAADATGPASPRPWACSACTASFTRKSTATACSVSCARSCCLPNMTWCAIHRSATLT
jgi:hypothetical protein